MIRSFSKRDRILKLLPFSKIWSGSQNRIRFSLFLLKEKTVWPKHFSLGPFPPILLLQTLIPSTPSQPHSPSALPPSSLSPLFFPSPQPHPSNPNTVSSSSSFISLHSLFVFILHLFSSLLHPSPSSISGLHHSLPRESFVFSLAKCSETRPIAISTKRSFYNFRS